MNSNAKDHYLEKKFYREYDYRPSPISKFLNNEKKKSEAVEEIFLEIREENIFKQKWEVKRLLDASQTQHNKLMPTHSHNHSKIRRKFFPVIKKISTPKRILSVGPPKISEFSIGINTAVNCIRKISTAVFHPKLFGKTTKKFWRRIAELIKLPRGTQIDIGYFMAEKVNVKDIPWIAELPEDLGKSILYRLMDLIVELLIEEFLSYYYLTTEDKKTLCFFQETWNTLITNHLANMKRQSMLKQFPNAVVTTKGRFMPSGTKFRLVAPYRKLLDDNQSIYDMNIFKAQINFLRAVTRKRTTDNISFLELPKVFEILKSATESKKMLAKTDIKAAYDSIPWRGAVGLMIKNILQHFKSKTVYFKCRLNQWHFLEEKPKESGWGKFKLSGLKHIFHRSEMIGLTFNIHGKSYKPYFLLHSNPLSIHLANNYILEEILKAYQSSPYQSDLKIHQYLDDILIVGSDSLPMKTFYTNLSASMTLGTHPIQQCPRSIPLSEDSIIDETMTFVGYKMSFEHNRTIILPNIKEKKLVPLSPQNLSKVIGYYCRATKSNLNRWCEKKILLNIGDDTEILQHWILRVVREVARLTFQVGRHLAKFRRNQSRFPIPRVGYFSRMQKGRIQTRLKAAGQFQKVEKKFEHIWNYEFERRLIHSRIYPKEEIRARPRNHDKTPFSTNWSGNEWSFVKQMAPKNNKDLYFKNK